MNSSVCAICQTGDILELVVFTFRGLILLLCAGGGILSIYLGWRLYKDSMLIRTEGSMQFSNMRLRLISGGPGIFFCAFGMWLLVQLVQKSASTQDATGSNAHTSALNTASKGNVTTRRPPSLAPLMTLIADADTQTTDKNSCLIKKRTIVLFDSKNILEPIDVKADLSAAVEMLRSQIDLNAPMEDPENRKRRKVIRTLQHLDQNVEIQK